MDSPWRGMQGLHSFSEILTNDGKSRFAWGADSMGINSKTTVR